MQFRVILSVVLLLLGPGQDCSAFVSLSDVKFVKNLSVRSSTSGPNDPYEAQYAAYAQAQQSSNTWMDNTPAANGAPIENTVVANTNGYNPTAPQNTNSPFGAEVSTQQQPQQQQQQQYTTMATPAPTSTDPYELQYQKFFQSQTTKAAAIDTTAQVVYNDDAASAAYNNGGADSAPQSYTYYQPPPVETQSPPTESYTYYQPPSVEPQSMAAPAAATDQASNGVAADTTYSTYFPPPAAAVPENNMNAMQQGAVPGNAIQQSPQEEEQEELTPEQQAELEDKYLEILSTEFGYKKLIGQNPYALTDIPVKLVLSRILDSLEDNAIAKKNKKARPEDVKPDRPTVVVLGSGWGAHSFVKLASTLDVRVIVVSPVNHFVFTPMLASAAVGTVEYRSMTEPIRVTNPSIDNYVEGRATHIDVENQTVEVRLTSDGISTSGKINMYTDDSANVINIPYDHLICAVGTKVRSSMVPGAEEHCFNLKTAQDSKKLRTAVQEALENACRADLEGWSLDVAQQKRWRRVAFVIIGGGPTGVELAGELNDFLLDICQPRTGPYSRLMNDFSITLIHGGEDLLPQFDQQLRHRALEALQERGVEVRLNTRVSEVGKKYVTLKRKSDGVEETIPAGVTVWAAGNEPVPLLKDLLSQLPESAVGSAGRIKVDQWLRCPTHTPERFGSIFVIGDAGDMTINENDPTKTLPQTAQVAGQQGAFMARMFNRGYDLKQTPPKLPEYDKLSQLRIWLLVRGLEEAPDFVFLNLGLLAYVGGGEALTQVQAGDVPIIGLAGKGAFALWRSVYLAKQASTKNRSQLVFDWAKSQSYGRDLTRL